MSGKDKPCKSKHYKNSQKDSQNDDNASHSLRLPHDLPYIMLIHRLDVSEVAVKGKVVGCFSAHVFLKQIEVFLFDWVNFLHDIPLDSRGAWRGRQRTSVGPSLRGVHHLQKVSYVDFVNHWVAVQHLPFH